MVDGVSELWIDECQLGRYELVFASSRNFHMCSCSWSHDRPISFEIR